MLNKLSKSITFLILLSLFSCADGNENWELYLYEQKIEGTSKALYKYDAWGGFDTHITGYTILDTTQNFEMRKRKELPIFLLTEIPNKNLVQAMQTKPYTNDEPIIYNPVESKKTTIGEISLKTDFYQSKAYNKKAHGYEELEFNNFKETIDSIYFYDLNEYTHKNTGHLDSLKIKKGNVFVAFKPQSDTIHRIYIDDLTISDDANKSLISKVVYHLKPKYQTKISEISDYGIFKTKNTMPNNVYKK
jgi:hypothetical protein